MEPNEAQRLSIWNVMPARAKSLRITDRYRRDMVRLRRQGQREAKRIWQHVSPDNLDATFNIGILELTVSTLQKEAARLSSAYLSAFISSELGQPVRPPAVRVWDKAFGGGDLREGLRSAVIATKQKIADGEDARDATNASRANLVSTVGLFIDTAARESLREGMVQEPSIVGYKRAIKGTCEACMGMADGSTLPEGTPLDIHPNCECVSEPVVRPQSQWYWKNAEERFGIETPSGVEAAGIKSGTQASAAARAYTTGAYRDLNRRLAAGETLTREQEAIYKSLMGAMRDLPERPTVWRGLRDIGPVGSSDAKTFQLLGDWAEKTFTPGSTIRLKGLQSCSFDTQPAIDAALGKKSPGVIFEIQAKNGVYLGAVSEFSDEAELLLNGGRFRVQGVLRNAAMRDTDGETRRRVIVQLIQL